MGFGILRIERDRLTKGRQAGIQIIFLVIDDPERQPGLLSGWIKAESPFQMLLGFGKLSEPKFRRTKVGPSHWMGGCELAHFLKFAFGIIELAIVKIVQSLRGGRPGILGKGRQRRGRRIRGWEK